MPTRRAPRDNSVKLTFSLPWEYYQILKLEAESEGVYLAHYVRDLVQAQIDKIKNGGK